MNIIKNSILIKLKENMTFITSTLHSDDGSTMLF